MSISPHPHVYFAYKAGASLRDATVTRGSVGGYTTRTGLYATKAANIARLHWRDIDGDGVHEVARLLMEGTRTNLVTDSDDLSGWSTSGTPVVTAAAATHGELQLSRVEDDDGASVEFVHIAPSFTGDAVKAVSFYVKRGNTAAPTSEIRLEDSTAGVARLRVQFDTTDIPSAAISGGFGTLLAVRTLGLGLYRIECQTDSVTAANTHQLRAIPAAVTGSDTGDFLVGGFQVEDAPYPSSLRRTSGGTAARNADQIDFSASVPLHKDWTLYAKGALLHGALSDVGTSVFPDLIDLLDSDSAQRVLLFRDDNTAALTASWRQPVEGSVSQTWTPPLADPFDLLLQHDSSDHALSLALNGGALGSGPAPTAQTKPYNQGISTVRLRNDGFWEVDTVKLLSGLVGWSDARNAPTAVGA